MTIEEKVKITVDEIVDEGYDTKDVFDEFCNRMDEWLEKRGLQAYIRVFWWKDAEELDEILDEVNDIRDRFDVCDYVFWPCQEYEATFAVMAYPKD